MLYGHKRCLLVGEECLLVGEEYMSSCWRRIYVFLWETNICLLVGEEYVFLLEKNIWIWKMSSSYYFCSCSFLFLVLVLVLLLKTFQGALRLAAGAFFNDKWHYLTNDISKNEKKRFL